MESLYKDLIAPCGMNCGICVGFFGYCMNGKKRKMKCPGCVPRDKSCAFVKNHCKKLLKKELEYCYECDLFPCERLEKLDNKYRERFKMSMIDNLICIRDHGMDIFLRQQQEKYQCSICGSRICVHTGICYSCQDK